MPERTISLIIIKDKSMDNEDAVVSRQPIAINLYMITPFLKQKSKKWFVL